MTTPLAQADPTEGTDADIVRPVLIDVVIPVYNCEGTVEAAIASIQQQTVHDIRIIVVDDGSTDRTFDIARRMASADARIRLIGKSNSGIVDSLNLGLSICEAPYFARHDGDDLAYPHRLARQLAYLDGDPDCVAVGAWARLIDRNGEPTGEYSRAAPPDTADAASVPAREPYLLHPFLLARSAAVRQVGGYRHVYLAEDSDLYWRLQEVGSLINLREVLGDYRVHASSTTARSIGRGRMNALFSELAAISALRRRSGRPDFSFTAGFVEEVSRCDGFPAIVAAASALVDEDERRWLSIAAAAKLIDLTFIRHYALQLEDCRYIRAAFDAGRPMLDRVNRRNNTERLIRLAKALIECGRIDLAMIVVPPTLYPRLLLRLAVRWIVPSGLRRWAKVIAGRAT